MLEEKEIRNLTALVDVVTNKVQKEVKEGKTSHLKELLWNVPTKVLAEFATRDENR